MPVATFFTLCVSLCALTVSGEEQQRPTLAVEQTHLALTGIDGEMRATFVVMAPSAAVQQAGAATVVWGKAADALTNEVSATNHT